MRFLHQCFWHENHATLPLPHGVRVFTRGTNSKGAFQRLRERFPAPREPCEEGGCSRAVGAGSAHSRVGFSRGLDLTDLGLITMLTASILARLPYPRGCLLGKRGAGPVHGAKRFGFIDDRSGAATSGSVARRATGCNARAAARRHDLMHMRNRLF